MGGWVAIVVALFFLVIAAHVFCSVVHLLLQNSTADANTLLQFIPSNPVYRQFTLLMFLSSSCFGCVRRVFVFFKYHNTCYDLL